MGHGFDLIGKLRRWDNHGHFVVVLREDDDFHGVSFQRKTETVTIKTSRGNLFPLLSATVPTRTEPVAVDIISREFRLSVELFLPGLPTAA